LDLADLYAFPKPNDASKSIFVMNVHPSYGENSRSPTSDTPFAPEALYELKIDSAGDSVADIAYRVRFSPSRSGSQAARLCRAEGRDARAADDAADSFLAVLTNGKVTRDVQDLTGIYSPNSPILGRRTRHE
jgi:hypothetical protein